MLGDNRQDDEYCCCCLDVVVPVEGCSGIVNKSHDFRQSLLLLIHL